MKLVKTYLHGDGQMPMNPFTGTQPKPSGKTIDAWVSTNAPRDYFKGSRPPRDITGSQRFDPNAYAAQGDVIRVHVYAPGD